jgi:Flp pilus assembly pilin Flp
VTNLAINLYSRLMGLLRREEGQDLIEYALIGGLVAVALLAAFVLLDTPVQTMVTEVGECIDFQSDTGCNIGIG